MLTGAVCLKVKKGLVRSPTYMALIQLQYTVSRVYVMSITENDSLNNVKR